MSRATPDDQVKFLLSCIKFCNNGKIDFVEVARECHVVSKGAAAKRYERLQKSVGYQVNGPIAVEKPLSDIPQRSKKPSKLDGQKRKRGDGIADEHSIDTLKREGTEENKSRPHFKREKVDSPHIQDLHMLSRGSAYNPYMQAHSPFVPAPMPHFMHPNMRPPSHFTMIPSQYVPPPPPYGHITDGLPNHQFMMPLNPMQTYPIPQTVQSMSSPGTGHIATFHEDGHSVESQNGTHTVQSMFHGHVQPDQTVSNTLPTSINSAEGGQQAVPTDAVHSDSFVKQEAGPSPLPDLWEDYLKADFKIEKESEKEDETIGMSSIKPEMSNVDGTGIIQNSEASQDSSTHNQQISDSDKDSNVKKEEESKYLDDCIFISD